MSKYTPSPPNSTAEEFADMIQCYIDSGKNIELTRMYYVNRYPSRRTPRKSTLEKVVQNYLKIAESNTTAEPHEEVTKSASTKDDRILKYFISNSHATIKKAASKFNVHVCYIDKLLKDRKADMETMRNDYEIQKEERSLNDHIRQNKKFKRSINNGKQNQCDAEEVKNINIKEEENNAEKDQYDFMICHIETIKSEAHGDGVASKTSESEKPDITICSETSKRESDDDVIYCETITKKRKRKNKKRGVCKKQRTYESEDSFILETQPLHNLIVYTTRLDEMVIFRKNITNYNTTYIINQILLESKPKYTMCRSNNQVRSILSFRLLKKNLKKIKKRDAHVDLTYKSHNDSDEDDEQIVKTNQIKTDVINKIKIYTFNTKEEVVLDINRKCDVTIVINNLFSNTHDIYVTDSKGNVIEYYCAKLNDYLKYIIHSKCRLIFDMCCWFQRQRRIESIWPRHEYTLSRFLTTTHKCPPDQCLCCCKIEKRATSPVVYHKSYETDILKDVRSSSDFSDTESNEYNRSLILSALSYNKPEINKTNCSFSKPLNSTGKRFNFLEYFEQRDTAFVRIQYCEIGINQEIVRFHTDSHVRTRSCCIRCGELSLMSGEPISKLVVCCQWKRDRFLIEEYNACNISSNTLRFLRNTVFPPVCEICKVTLNVETNKSASLDVLPRIEHSRLSVKPTLLKIGVKVQMPPLTHNPNYIGIKDKARQIPDRSNVMNEVETAASEVEASKLTSTVTLNVCCKQMPELDFEIRDVRIQVATMIVTKFKQMSLTVKDGGKVVASLNSSMQATTSEEFKVFAHILQNTQNILKRMPISPGSSIDLEVKIDNDKQNSCQTFENVNQDVDVACNHENTRNDPNKGGLIKILPIQETNINRNFNKCTNNNNNKCDVANLVINATNNRFPPSSRGVERNKKKAVNKRNVIIVPNKSEEFNTFAKVISCGKKCYADSFKSYLNAERETGNRDVSVPKITGVFSLKPSMPTKLLFSPNETGGLNNLDTVTPVPSSKNDSVNNLNAVLPPAQPPVGKQATGIIYDPITKVAQIVNLTPTAFVNLAKADANSSITNENVVQVKPLGMGTDSTLAVLSPINTSRIQLPYQSIHEKPILPDLINDIPISNHVMATNHTVVKDELGDEVVLLDSD